MENKNAITENVLATGELLVKAIAAVIRGEDFEFPQGTDFEKLYKLAFSHRVASNVAGAVIGCEGAPDEVKTKFKKELFRTSARYEALKLETEKISRLFSQNEIKHCFLKGVKVCAFHNEPSTRFMLDMDVFVDGEKIAEAEKILQNEGYEQTTFGDDKDTGFSKKPFFNIELHRELKYDYDKGYDYYKGAFDRMKSDDGFALDMTNEDFYVYILSHTAHHFEVSGTGIKNIIDHYFLMKKLLPLCDGEKLKNNLKSVGLERFSESMDRLCRCWFEGEEYDEITEKMAEYVILSGVFGNDTNQYFSGIMRGEYSEKKSSYFLHRLFPPYVTMKKKYAILEKLPFLLPVFWIVRIFTSVFSSKGITEEAKNVSAAKGGEFSAHRRFMEDVGI